MIERRIFLVISWSVALVFCWSAVASPAFLSRLFTFVLSGLVLVSGVCAWPMTAAVQNRIVKNAFDCFIELLFLERVTHREVAFLLLPLFLVEAREGPFYVTGIPAVSIVI